MHTRTMLTRIFLHSFHHDDDDDDGFCSDDDYEDRGDDDFQDEQGVTTLSSRFLPCYDNSNAMAFGLLSVDRSREIPSNI